MQDKLFTGQLLIKCNTLHSGFKGVVTSIPRYYFWSVDKRSSVCILHGFCDTSSGAYAAVMHIKVVESVQIFWLPRQELPQYINK